MTIDEIKAMDCDFITPATAASAMRMDVGRLVGYAKDGQLPFPVIISGNRVKIPRQGFLKWCGVIEEDKEKHSRLDRIEKEIHDVNVALATVNVLLMGVLAGMAPEKAESLISKMEEGGLKQ